MRGILYKNCFWWRLNDMMKDKSGVLLYQKLKSNGRFVNLKIMNSDIQLVTTIEDIRVLLHYSPSVFGVGNLKYNFFQSFMKYNVGVSNDPHWKPRRLLNECVLDNIVNNISYIERCIEKTFDNYLPRNSNEFQEYGRKLSDYLLFGETKPEYHHFLYRIFSESNSIIAPFFPSYNPVFCKTKEYYHRYLEYYIHHPIPQSMVHTALVCNEKANSPLQKQEFIDQIPHWIFPISGLVNVALPRLLCLLINHPQSLEKIRNREIPIRHAILELFRLNNPVNSTFRTVTKDITINNTDYKKGQSFVFFNNPVMRDPLLYDRPNEFLPQRWDTINENEYRVLMFNQGPQICPGKELALLILEKVVEKYLVYDCLYCTKSLDTMYIDQMINPCLIEIDYC